MSKHTKGPWINPGHDGSAGWADVIGADGACIAYVYDAADKGSRLELLYKKSDFGPPLSEAYANARLIAAAPCMLGALRGILAGLPPFNADRHPVLADDVARARAAIAKATGGAP